MTVYRPCVNKDGEVIAIGTADQHKPGEPCQNGQGTWADVTFTTIPEIPLWFREQEEALQKIYTVPLLKVNNKTLLVKTQQEFEAALAVV